MTGRVIVVGGGLAGVSAALRLAEQGREVTVFEARPRLGGATYSFPRGELTVDTGQHVLLRCYGHHLALLKSIGADHLVRFQPQLDIPVLQPTGGRPARIRRSAQLPAPLHLVRALAGYRALSPRERFAAASAAAALGRVDPDDPATDLIPFGDWLRAHGQGARAVDRLWRLVVVAALNIAPDEASLALAARVVRSGLLEHAASGDIGVPTVPLTSLHDEPARAAFARRGIRLHSGHRVRAIEDAGAGVIVRTDGGDAEADAVVVAVPHAQAARLVPEGAAPERAGWSALGDSPIVNVHVLYDRPVTRLPFAAALDSPVQWIFDRTEAAGAGRGQYLVSSISAADRWIALPADRIREEQLRALAQLLPAARTARVLDAFVTREPRATFRQRAGSARLRPGARTRWPSVVLAGAWTATGWPDTMEGAVRSGLAAATELLAQPAPHGSERKDVMTWTR